MTGRSKTERFEKTEENVDNRIQYVGQIAREGKLSKKNQSQETNRVIKKRMADEERGEKRFSPFNLHLSPLKRTSPEEGPVPYIT